MMKKNSGPDIRCTNCPYKERSSVCPPTLRGGSDLLIVGEGPGVEEIRKQTPFIGPSGKLLWTALEKSGVTPEHYLRISVTNSTLCRPPLDYKVDSGLVQCCRERLLCEVMSEKPKVILALGTHATHAVTGNFNLKIMQVHGMRLTIDSGPLEGTIVVPCIHPAAVLRKGSDYVRFQAALDYAVELSLQGAYAKHPGTTTHFVAVEACIGEVISRLLKLPKNTLLGADIETTGFNPRRDRVVAAGVAWAKNKVIIFPGDVLLHPSVRLFFESPDFKWVWHNGKFDVKFLLELGINARVDEDTMLAHYALNEVKGTHDLGSLSVEYLGASDYKDEVSKYVKKGWQGCPVNLLCTYLSRDCDYTLQLWKSLSRDLSQVDGLEKLYRNLLLPASDLLTEVERNGFWANPEEIQRVRGILDPKRYEAYDKLQAAVRSIWPTTKTFREFGSAPPLINPASSPQVCKLLYHDLYLKAPKGYLADSREATLIALPKHPIIDALLEYREHAKALSTYVDGLERRIDRATGRVHATYLIHGTVTGRLSSRDPNNQNIPRDPLIRGLYQAPDGRLLLETDLDQAELRVLANLSKDPELIHIYNSGRKLHHEVATEMYGKDFTPDQYIRAKAINFGIMYGRGASSLVKEFGGPNIPRESRLTLTEAERLIATWFGRFPVAYQFVQDCRNAPANGMALRSPSGRRRRFGLVTGRNLHELQNEAANFPIQSTASDITLLSAYRVRSKARELGGIIVNLVHDSIIYEISDDRDVARIISTLTANMFQTVGVELIGDAVPMTAEFKLGTCWGSLQKVKF